MMKMVIGFEFSEEEDLFIDEIIEEWDFNFVEERFCVDWCKLE